MKAAQLISRIDESFSPADVCDFIPSGAKNWACIRADAHISACKAFLQSIGARYTIIDGLEPIGWQQIAFSLFNAECNRDGLTTHVIVSFDDYITFDYLLFGTDMSLEQLSRQFTRWKIKNLS